MKRLFLLALSGLMAFSSAQAAESIHIFLKGKVTGEIQGDGKEGAIMGLAFEHEIVSPRDASSGLPTGRRQHKPLTIVKPIDKASPLVMKMLTTNETCDMTLKFFRKNAQTGASEEYYSIKLTNATVCGVRAWKPNTRDVSADRAGDLEEVSFTYQKIEWIYKDGGVTHEDSWETQQT